MADSDPTATLGGGDVTDADDVSPELLDLLVPGDEAPDEALDDHEGVAAVTLGLLHQDGHIEHYSLTADDVDQRQAQIDNIARLIAHTAFICNEDPGQIASDVAESLTTQLESGGISHWFGPPADAAARRSRVDTSATDAQTDGTAVDATGTDGADTSAGSATTASDGVDDTSVAEAVTGDDSDEEASTETADEEDVVDPAAEDPFNYVNYDDIDDPL